MLSLPGEMRRAGGGGAAGAGSGGVKGKTSGSGLKYKITLVQKRV